MNLEEALLVANAAVFDRFGKRLNDVETAIVRGAWESQTYIQIAEASGYSISYITRDVGPKLWKMLSEALGERVSKTSFRAALERKWQQQTPQTPTAQPEDDRATDSQKTPQDSPVQLETQTDWGEAIDVSRFYGRGEELATLERWIIGDRCRLVALLGMGGIGKTSLSVKLAQQLQGDFECVIWRSLRNAPTLETLLGELVPFVSEQEDTQPELKPLMAQLRARRCLLVLDNAETLLEAGCAGQYRVGYEAYGELLRLVGETAHQSCVILTSREKPADIAALEGMELAVRSLSVRGLQAQAEVLLLLSELTGDDLQKQQLLEHYGGNPLALKIVSTSIQELFDGDIGEFLSQNAGVFNSIRRLLDRQFDRLSALEQNLMYWLAIDREWAKISELAADIIPSVSRSKLLGALESLSWRSLIEKQTGKYTQQPVVMGYTTDRLVEKVSHEIITGEISLLNCHALLKASEKDYIRESQNECILKPILAQILFDLHTHKNIESQISKIIKKLQKSYSKEPGYTGGNLLNLLVQLQTDLSGYDFSNLTLWQADLREVNLQNCNFAGADLGKSVLTETLGIPLTVAFSPDGECLATGDADREIVLWSPIDGQKRLTCKGHSSWVWSVAWSRDGRILASGSEDRTVKLWDARTGNLLNTLHGHTNPIWSVAWSPDGKTLASSSEDRTIKLWDIPTGKMLQTLLGHEGWVRSVAWSPDGKTLASGSEDRTVKLWNLDSGRCYKILQGHTNWVRSVAFSPDGNTLASASGDHTIKFWDTQSSQCYKTLQGHNNRVWSIAWSPDGKTLVGGYDDRTVKLWNVEETQIDRTWWGHANWVCTVAWSADGNTLASGSSDRTIKVWDVRTGQVCRTLQGHTSRVLSLAFSPDNRTLVSSSYDRTVKLWNTHTGECIRTIEGQTDFVWTVALSRDGQTIASSSGDRTVKLWDTRTGECIRTLEGHTNLVWAVVFSPDGNTLASGSDDLSVKLWNIHTGECIQTLEGHTNRVWTVAFSPDGNTLASGSSDRTVKLWDVITGQCIQTLEGHTNLVWTVAFSPDGNTLASGSQDETIELWDVQTGKRLKMLRAARPYEGMNVSGVTGLTEPQTATLKALGAIEVL
ncbi:pentapeptide repeat-containing protein [Oscillatoriales cyanobacterium LEGE 11467]|uniref:Pentapeptide repeat-containing protein n=1 Tax=Zarconia navalis LEGE 11467 TaxID=1828826 RepID=A0A928ZBD1_9CYAN|nr:NB-ARC domain-containing protein [Zarconia navalis]MBE9042551.1 pentapeptide repeat-containing protein [Zarconia navalis LEGE 11467]